MLDIPCVIFAGGKSSRMGEDKALLPFAKEKTLTQYQLHNFNKIFKNVYISCKDKHKFDFDANFIEDIKSETSVYAPTSGFVAIFKKLQEDRFFAISVDAPFITKKEIYKILQADKDDVDAVVAQTEFAIQPMCGIYHRSLEPKFIDMYQKNNHKLGFLLKSSKTIFLKFDDEKPFLNLNHPAQYKEALKISPLTH
ncbi:MAG: molybdenum cofactor guanylyltransferase MobA [Epsilonproteobacteria bacterium]|nr:molybdenum cofactor guanylyltransferase MobA [Campylobacterota bacterium]